MSLLIGPDTIFIRKGSVLANRAGREVSLLIGPDTTFFCETGVLQHKLRSAKVLGKV